MKFDDPLGDGQAQPSSPRFRIAALIAAVEPLEDVRNVLIRNSATGVGDLQSGMIKTGRDGNRDHSVFCVTYRVLNQVVEQPLDQRDVAVNKRHVWREPAFQGDAPV